MPKITNSMATNAYLTEKRKRDEPAESTPDSNGRFFARPCDRPPSTRPNPSMSRQRASAPKR